MQIDEQPVNQISDQALNQGLDQPEFTNIDRAMEQLEDNKEDNEEPRANTAWLNENN